MLVGRLERLTAMGTANRWLVVVVVVVVVVEEEEGSKIHAGIIQAYKRMQPPTKRKNKTSEAKIQMGIKQAESRPSEAAETHNWVSRVSRVSRTVAKTKSKADPTKTEPKPRVSTKPKSRHERVSKKKVTRNRESIMKSK